MAAQDRDRTVIKTGSNAGWLVAIILAIVLAGAALAYYNGWIGNNEPDVQIEIDLPGSG